MPRTAAHEVHPKEVDQRAIYFSVTLIACEAFHVLCVREEDGLTPFCLRVRKMTESALNLYGERCG